MQARKDDGFALLVAYCLHCRIASDEQIFGKYGAVSEKSLKNRQRAIFRRQRHFPTQDFGGFGAFYDGGNRR